MSEVSDKTLLALFEIGWEDEEEGINIHKSFRDKLEESAYLKGRAYRLMDFDLSSLSNEELVDKIKESNLW